MRSQSSGQGVLTKTKQPKNAKATTSNNHTSHTLTDPMSIMAIHSQSPSSTSHSVVVDPSLEHMLQSGHNIGDGLGASDGEGSAFTSSHHLMNIPFASNSSMMRGHFAFNDTGGHDMEGEPPDHDPDSALDQETHDMLLRNNQNETPDGDADLDGDRDSSDPQYRSVRLPPILQVEKQLVTTTATQAASATRRKNEAVFKCPVPGCGSTFTRRFNLRGHLRSHTEERPFVCDWPGCGKGFARSHDCKRHTALHTAKQGSHVCAGCNKTFSRTDALNRHLKSDVGATCRGAVAEAQVHQASSRHGSAQPVMPDTDEQSIPSPDDITTLDQSIHPVPFMT